MDTLLLFRFLGAAFAFALGFESSSSFNVSLDFPFFVAAFFFGDTFFWGDSELSSSDVAALLLFRFLGAAFFFALGFESPSSSDVSLDFPFFRCSLFFGRRLLFCSLFCVIASFGLFSSFQDVTFRGQRFIFRRNISNVIIGGTADFGGSGDGRCSTGSSGHYLEGWL